jgi:hypothetical protein
MRRARKTQRANERVQQAASESARVGFGPDAAAPSGQGAPEPGQRQARAQDRSPSADGRAVEMESNGTATRQGHAEELAELQVQLERAQKQAAESRLALERMKAATEKQTAETRKTLEEELLARSSTEQRIAEARHDVEQEVRGRAEAERNLERVTTELQRESERRTELERAKLAGEGEIAGLKKALADHRSDAEQQLGETKRALDKVRAEVSEAERLATELAETEERVEAGHRLLDEARAEAQRERERRELLEHRVRGLTDMAAAGASDPTAGARPQDPSTTAPPRLEAPVGTVQPEPPDNGSRRVIARDAPRWSKRKRDTGPETGTNAGGDQDEESVPAPGRTRRPRRGKVQPFIDESGACAVCSSELRAKSASGLEASGWVIQGGQGLCPSCQEDGWQLPAGALVPVRTIPARH